MSDKAQIWLSRVRTLVKTFVNENYPEEASFFEEVWGVFESRAREWMKLPPDKYAVVETLGRVTSEFGLVDEESMDLVTPRFLAMLLATLFDVSADSPADQSEKVSAALVRYAKRFKVPKDVVSRSEPMVRMLLKKDYESLGFYSELEPVETIVLLRSDKKPLEGPEEELALELQQARDEKQTFDIYLDDLKNEFRVNGHEKNLTMDPKILLIMLLQKVGAYWRYSELGSRLWGDDMKASGQLHNLRNRLHKATEHLLEPYIVLPRGQERCYILEEVKQNVKYCAIFLATDYPCGGFSLAAMNPH